MMWIADLLKGTHASAASGLGPPSDPAVPSGIPKAGNQRPRCDQCHYYSGIDAAGTSDAPIQRGQCNRYPPQICVDMNSRIRVVLAQWWCGEWRE